MTLCPCGSSLPETACCGLDPNQLRLVEPTPAVEPRLAEARRAEEAKDWGGVTSLCSALLTEAPGLWPAMRMLMLAHARRGNQRPAGVLNARLGKLTAGSPPALAQVVIELTEHRAWEEAEPHARNAVRIAPQDADAHRRLGVVLMMRMHAKEGEYHLRRALALSGDPKGVSALLLVRLAAAMKLQANLPGAQRLLREVLARSPNLVPAILGLIEVEEQAGRLDEATTLLARAEALEPDHAGYRRIHAVLAGRRKDHARVVQILAPADGQPPLAPEELLLKGKALDRLGDHEAAFSAYEIRSQILQADGNAYDPTALETINRDCKRFFRRPVFETLPRARTRSDGAQPLFVMGFPRSGTTMMEQSLSMHPRITAAGEIQALPRLATNAARLLESPLAYPDCLSDLWLAEQRHGLDLMRDMYLREAADSIAPKADAAWFTDKMLFHQLNVGLIGLVFPRSPVLHVVRHPLDVVLSVFSHELAVRSGYAASLKAAAHHYHLHMDMLRHYLTEMPGLRYLQVRYEDVVDAQEAMMRQILAFIGEPFDDACLRFHENKRDPLTLSSHQVTEKLNTRGRYRYRHYLRHLEPIIPMLQPWIDYFGYRVEDARAAAPSNHAVSNRVATVIEAS